MSRESTPVVLAIDVGGTSLKGALVDAGGHTAFETTLALEGATGDAAVACLLALGTTLRTQAAAQRLDPLAAGVIAPGMDDSTGRVLFSSNLGWRDLPVGPLLADHLGLPVATGHDVRTAGLAEGTLGAGRGAAEFVFVMIGTGIAAALVTRGTAIAGHRNMSGEFGHTPVHPGGDRCLCGQSGCLEAYASAAAIARRYRAQGGATPLSAAEIARTRHTDPLAQTVWAEAVEALAIGLTTLTMLLDPACFVLGGGLAEAGPVLLEPLAAALDRRLAWRTAPPIHRSVLGLSAGRIGAAMLAFRLAGRPDVVGRWGP